jgi:hypothetical protein
VATLAVLAVVLLAGGGDGKQAVHWKP